MDQRAVLASFAAAVAALVLAAPAMAAGEGVSIPEPSDLALFGLGVIGLILGRRGARARLGKKPPRK